MSKDQRQVSLIQVKKCRDEQRDVNQTVIVYHNELYLNE